MIYFFSHKSSLFCYSPCPNNIQAKAFTRCFGEYRRSILNRHQPNPGPVIPMVIFAVCTQPIRDPLSPCAYEQDSNQWPTNLASMANLAQAEMPQPYPAAADGLVLAK